MKAGLSDWLKLAATLLLVVVLTGIIALALNLGGYCGPSVENCGAGARRLSFVVLGSGFASAAFLTVRFLRAHRP